MLNTVVYIKGDPKELLPHLDKIIPSKGQVIINKNL